MFEVDKQTKTIHLTRGDIACINVTAKDKKETPDGIVKTPHKFEVGDVVRLKVVKKGNYGQVVFKKSVVVSEETEKVMMPLNGQETKIGEIISKPTTYWYEIELNPDTNPQTIIGHDKETGAKLFVLYPEGSDK